MNLFQMPEFQFRHHWQTDSCFYLWALKSCLMTLKSGWQILRRVSEMVQTWDAPLHPQEKCYPEQQTLDTRHEEQGKEEGWCWVVGLGSTTQWRFLVREIAPCVGDCSCWMDLDKFTWIEWISEMFWMPQLTACVWTWSNACYKMSWFSFWE